MSDGFFQVGSGWLWETAWAVPHMVTPAASLFEPGVVAAVQARMWQDDWAVRRLEADKVRCDDLRARGRAPRARGGLVLARFDEAAEAGLAVSAQAAVALEHEVPGHGWVAVRHGAVFRAWLRERVEGRGWRLVAYSSVIMAAALLAPTDVPDVAALGWLTPYLGDAEANDAILQRHLRASDPQPI